VVEQGSQQGFDGTRLLRWYVTVDRPKAKTIVTWAESEDAARRKAERRGLRVLVIEPAPHRV